MTVEKPSVSHSATGARSVRRFARALFVGGPLRGSMLYPAAALAAAQFDVLYNFSSSNNVGFDPQGALIADSSGALFGTTREGGKADLGTVFMLQPPAKGKKSWTASLLREFTGDANGSHP